MDTPNNLDGQKASEASSSDDGKPKTETSIEQMKSSSDGLEEIVATGTDHKIDSATNAEQVQTSSHDKKEEASVRLDKNTNGRQECSPSAIDCEVPEESATDKGESLRESTTSDNNDGQQSSKLAGQESGGEEDENDGEPIPSGTGVVSKGCAVSDLVGWSEILPKWHSKLNQRPRGLNPLVKNGIPEPLRGEVWQLLSGAHQFSDLMDQYRIYLTRSAPAEQIILRDVHRTYPAHENFRSDAGSDSLVDSLFKVCKAYSVYDEEVGYCQGLSFLVAALLLHMPEEQAFCVFVRIMQHYGLRDLFRNNFDELYLKFYLLERLLEDQMPDLYQHFKRINIEPFQYASQWFLTVFTAKFPLNAVFYIMDIFLLAGIETIFQIALALLAASKQELLASDFEGVLKFFRVQMPKRYRNQEHVQRLIMSASEINLKKLRTHTKNYETMKKKEKTLENPASKRERIKLTEAIVRLESENDNLARDLIASKIQLRAQLDLLEDKAEILNRALTYSRQDCQTYMNTISDMEDERSRLEIEVAQLKEVCRRELQRTESELQRNGKIIDDYKKICSQLSSWIDYHKRSALQFIKDSGDLLNGNSSCPNQCCLQLFQPRAEEFIEKLKSDKIDELDSSTSTAANGDSPASRSDQKSCAQLERRVSSESDHTKRPVGAYLKSDTESLSSELKIKQLTEHVNELEVELARTKLALVESECERQQLAHDTTPTAQSNDKSSPSSTTSTLSNKFELVKSAISSASSAASSSSSAVNRNKEGGGGNSALSRINNLISEKISNIGQGQQPPSSKMMPNSISTPTFVNSGVGGGGGVNWFGGRLHSPATNSNRNMNNNTLIAKPIDENEHQC